MNRGEGMCCFPLKCFCWIVFSSSWCMFEEACMYLHTGLWIYRLCAVQCEDKQARSTQAAERTELQCVPRPTSGVQEQGADLESVQIGLMRFPSTPSACQGPSGFLPAYLDCI